MKKLALIAAVLSLQTATAFAQHIDIKSDRLYPEGLVYSTKHDSFMVSSMRYGKIGWVDRNGVYKDFTNDPSLISTVGMHIDEKRNVLYAAVADPDVSDKSTPSTSFKTAKLAAYDLGTGEKKWIVDLSTLTDKSEKHLANDLAIGPRGEIYVTDTFSPNVYKVDPKGTATIFAHNDKFWRKEGFGLNGIVYHPDGYLIVNMTNTGELYSISVKNPKEINKIEAPVILGADGMVLNPSNKNEMLVISFTTGKISLLRTTDNWKTALTKYTVNSDLPGPTTAVWLDGTYYVLNSKITEAFDKKSPRASSDFAIQKLKFND